MKRFALLLAPIAILVSLSGCGSGGSGSATTSTGPPEEVYKANLPAEVRDAENKHMEKAAKNAAKNAPKSAPAANR